LELYVGFAFMFEKFAAKLRTFLDNTNAKFTFLVFCVRASVMF
jgi:hypothetical protein